VVIKMHQWSPQCHGQKRNPAGGAGLLSETTEGSGDLGRPSTRLLSARLVASRLCPVELTGRLFHEQSHDYAWEIAKLGEEIPYHATFANRIRDPEGEELAWASRRAKELGLP
jgi:hypothetical protein